MLTPEALAAAHRRADSIEVDNLTGLGNLFAFLKALKQVLPQVAAQPGELLAAVLFDIDNLASVQDAIGEQATNYVITTIASALYRAMPIGPNGRRTARLFRFTGDEFAMLLRHHECQQIKTQIAHMQQEVARLVWETYPHPITISASLACFPSCASGLGDLLAYTNLFMKHTKDNRKGGITCPGNTEHQNAQSLSVELHNNATALVETLSNRILETAEQLQQTTQLAMSDPLTELPNLRAARQVLREQLEYANQVGVPLGLLLVDGDRLKEYNQLYGYSAGNEMIRWLANTLQDWCGVDGFVARWLSGDEFLMIVPNFNLADCNRYASDLCAHVHEASRELPIPITVSVGVASCPESAATAQQLIDMVERANKRAKDAGRNRASD